MGKKTLFSKYFKIFSIMIITSFVLLGVVFISVAANSFQEDNYVTLNDRRGEVHSFTVSRMRYNSANNTILYSYELKEHYRINASLTNSLIFFCDMNGKVLISSSTDMFGNAYPADVPEGIFNRMVENGSLAETNTLGGRLSDLNYIVAQPVYSEGGNVIGGIFVASSAKAMYNFVQNMIQSFAVSMLLALIFVFIIVYINTKRQIFVASSAKAMYNFVQNMIQSFAVSMLLALIFVFIIVYINTKRQIFPLQVMVEATKRFSRGDFTMRVPVDGDDEVSQLAEALNSMATSIADMESNQVMVEATKRFSRGDFTMRVPVDGDDEVSQLAEALNSMATSIADMESNRRSFTANVSHELKTPMTSIGGFIDGILDGTIPPEKQNYYLQIVSDETKRLSRLVNSMLNISKIEAGEQKLKIAAVDITSLVISATLMFEKKIEEKRIEVRGLDSPRYFVNADEGLIHQVIYNLVDNAVKFVNEDGYLEFSYTANKDSAYISVKNSGDGIRDDELLRVFDRFYKTDRSRGLDKNGVGLGLYIVRTIINLHGGDIKVKSVVNEYTEFTFSLPITPKAKKK